MALYNLWLFVWDDVFDGEDELQNRPSDMEHMFDRTVTYVEYHLGLCDPSMPEPEAPTFATSLFQHAGALLREQADVHQRLRFFKEVVVYIKSCAYEQRIMDGGVLPTVQEYWAYRLGTSSVYTGCALAE